MQLVNWQVSVHVCSPLACWLFAGFAVVVWDREYVFVHLLCNYFRSPDQCWVLGYRKSCRPYPSCKRWWYSPLWPGCFWKCILLSWTETSFVSPLFTYYCSCLGRLKRNPEPRTDGVICVGLCDQWQNACCHMLAHTADEQQSLSEYLSVLTSACELFILPWLWTRCVVEVVCLPPPKPGAAGTAGSTQPRSVMPSARLWLPLPSPPLWCPKVSSNNNTE